MAKSKDETLERAVQRIAKKYHFDQGVSAGDRSAFQAALREIAEFQRERDAEIADLRVRSFHGGKTCPETVESFNQALDRMGEEVAAAIRSQEVSR